MATAPIPLTARAVVNILLIFINIDLFMIGFPFFLGPKLNDFPPAIIFYAGQFSDKGKSSLCTKKPKLVESATVPTFSRQPRWAALLRL
jgi:hypothetical protein